MGLIVNIYRTAGIDCTNGGFSSKHDKLCVTNVSGPFDPSDDAPAAVLQIHGKGIVRIVPPELFNAGRHSMFGGNFAATSDSRFSAAVERLTGCTFYGAVAIHDRVE